MSETEKEAALLAVRSNAGLERKLFDEWSRDGRRLGDMELLFAWEAWKASANIEREACANVCDEIANATEPDDFALDAVNDAAYAIRMRSNVQIEARRAVAPSLSNAGLGVNNE